jgi:hypothetical protein
MCSKMNVIGTCINRFRVNIILNLLRQQLLSETIVREKHIGLSDGRVLKSVAYLTLGEAADELRTTIFFQFFGVKEIYELVATSKRLKNNFAGLVTSGLVLDIARGPLVEPRWPLKVLVVANVRFRLCCVDVL